MWGPPRRFGSALGSVPQPQRAGYPYGGFAAPSPYGGGYGGGGGAYGGSSVYRQAPPTPQGRTYHAAQPQPQTPSAMQRQATPQQPMQRQATPQQAQPSPRRWQSASEQRPIESLGGHGGPAAVLPSSSSTTARTASPNPWGESRAVAPQRQNQTLLNGNASASSSSSLASVASASASSSSSLSGSGGGGLFGPVPSAQGARTVDVGDPEESPRRWAEQTYAGQQRSSPSGSSARGSRRAASADATSYGGGGGGGGGGGSVAPGITATEAVAAATQSSIATDYRARQKVLEQEAARKDNGRPRTATGKTAGSTPSSTSRSRPRQKPLGSSRPPPKGGGTYGSAGAPAHSVHTAPNWRARSRSGSRSRSRSRSGSPVHVRSPIRAASPARATPPRTPPRHHQPPIHTHAAAPAPFSAGGGVDPVPADSAESSEDSEDEAVFADPVAAVASGLRDVFFFFFFFLFNLSFFFQFFSFLF
jgi:hypothetical protein